MKSSNGFASVSYGSACTSLISGFTNRKDVGCGYQEGLKTEPTASFVALPKSDRIRQDSANNGVARVVLFWSICRRG